MIVHRVAETRRSRSLMCARGTLILLGGALFVTFPSRASSQAGANDLVVTGGLSWETYDGNFSVVTVPNVDSTRHVTAAVGEFGANGTVFLLNQPGVRSLALNFDGGLRQFAAMGFQRDYAPREWASRFSASYSQDFTSIGSLWIQSTYRGRAVEDRPPMPLFLQPSYRSLQLQSGFQFKPIQGVTFDTRLDLERTNYDSPKLLPWLDLLDRRSQAFEVGAVAATGGNWTVRFSTGLRRTQYPHQGEDPYRKDNTVNAGALWTLNTWIGEDEVPVRLGLGVEGTVNRSNSRRPEYDALSVTGNGFTELPWWDLRARVASILTWKAYVHQTQYARLVPGEEADNASVVHLDLIRPVASNLNATLRFGWTRAETDIGNSYYNRFGTSLLFNFRPAGQ